MYEYLTEIFTRQPIEYKYVIQITTTDGEQFEIYATPLLHDDKILKPVYDVKTKGYPLVLNSPRSLGTAEIKKTTTEILRGNNRFIQKTFKLFDIINVFKLDEFADLDNVFAVIPNLLFSNYSQMLIVDSENMTFVEMMNPVELKLDQNQEVIRFCQFNLRNEAPEYNLVYQNGKSFLLRNTLYLSPNEYTVYIMGANYFSINAHCGYIKVGTLIVWVVSTHILIRNIDDAGRDYRFVGHVTNVLPLIGAFKSICNMYQMVEISIHNPSSMYSYDEQNKTILFLGDFPMNFVSIDLQTIYSTTKNAQTCDI
jgi:hypothetical protein